MQLFSMPPFSARMRSVPLLSARVFSWPLLFVAAAMLLIGGCHSAIVPATRPTTSYAALCLHEPTAIAVLDAQAVWPLGWKPDPLKQNASHVHEVWISPDGRTAYGIIYFHLPLPVGHDLALWGFMNQMKQTEGEATLLNKTWDDRRQCIRFVAEGGLYKIRANLFVDGFKGWVVYAGTLRKQRVNEQDLAIAEAARDKTILGLPANGSHE